MTPDDSRLPDDRNAPRPAAPGDHGRNEHLLNAVALSAVALLRAGEFEPALTEVLRLVGGASHASSAYLIRVDVENNAYARATQVARWEDPGHAVPADLPCAATWNIADWGLEEWIAALARGELITRSVDRVTPAEQAWLAARCVLSVLVVPILVNGTWWGQIRLEDRQTARAWASGEIESVKILAELIGAALATQERILALSDAQRIVENSPVIIFRFGPQMPCPLLYVSANVSRYGHAPEEYLRVPTQWYQLIPYDASDLAIIHDGMESIVQGKARQIRHECHAIRPDGVLEWFDYTLNGVFDSAGRLTGLDGIALDITEQKHGRATEALLASIVEASGSAILAAKLDGTITSWNEGAARLYGYSAAEMIGQSIRVVVPPERQEEVQKDLKERAHTAHVRHFDTEHVRKNGTRIPVAITISPVLDAAGNLSGRSYIARDRIAQQQAADALVYRDQLLHAVMVGTAALIEAASIPAGIDSALRCLGESVRADRIMVLQNECGPATVPVLRGLWETPGIAAPLPSRQLLSANITPSDMAALAAWHAPLREGNAVITQRSSSVGAVRALMTRLQNMSTLLVPIFANGVIWGNLGIDECRAERQWTASEIDTIRTFADVTGSLFVRDETLRALGESEERFRVFGKTAQDGIITIDDGGLIRNWNPAAERILGYSAADAIGKAIHILLVPQRLRAQAADGMAHFITTGEGHDLCKTIEVAALRKDGSEISVELSLAGAWFAGKWEAMGILRDVTERNSAAAKLKFSNLLFRTEIEASPDGILVVNRNREIISFNQRFSNMWQVPLKDLIDGNDRIVLAKVKSLVKNPPDFDAQVNYLYDHPDENNLMELETIDGRIIERHSTTLRISDTENLGRIWFFHDLTEARKTEALAVRMAHFDDLTGLANRSDFIDAVQYAITKVKRGEPGFAVLYLDLDHFKDVNDTLGHAVGDGLLQLVAGRLKSNTRKGDTVARFGGDEFAILGAHVTNPAGAGILAAKLIAALSAPCTVQGHEIHTGVSIGVDLYSADVGEPEILLSHADLALYRAKAEGRATYRFFTDAMNKDAFKRVTLVAELRNALAGDELFLVYQPQVTIGTGRVTGLEALVRWRHPVRGILGPDIFIPIAEQSGLIVKLGRWVLMTACRQAKAWREAGIIPLRIGVNVSGVQFRSPQELEADVWNALQDSGLAPDLLELELTETVLMYAARESSELLLRLRAAGITIAIDDFGTGYSSLAYLRRFHASHIKIPQTFVRNLENDPGDAAIVKAVIGLGIAFGSMIIAEGVETPGQLALLKQWGCGEVQGFHFARPLSVQDATQLLLGDGILHPHPVVAEAMADGPRG